MTATPEEALTAAASAILLDQPWHKPYPEAEHSIRSMSVFVRGLGYVTLTQSCKLEDLSDWHNHMRAQGYQDRTMASFDWDRDQPSMIVTEKAWDFLHEVEETVVGAENETS